MPLAGATGRAVQVLIVDDEASVASTVSRCLEREGYDCVVATSAKEALRRLDETTFDVLVTDVRLPMMSGIDLLKTAKVRDPGIQVIVMTGCRDIDFAVEAIRSRVNDYLVKPFDLDQLSQAVRRAVENRAGRLSLEERVREQAGQIELLFMGGLSALTAAIDARDHYTSGHSNRVTRYALATGSELSLNRQQMGSLWLGALFHDVGKLAIPDAILTKQGPLTDEEYASIKRHPALGVKVIGRITFLRPAVHGILQHHERWAGKGYPAGLKGEGISIDGRILAVCDAFDAMTSDRPYRKARAEEEAVVELKRCSGTQFDPSVVESFLRTRDKGFPVSIPGPTPATG